MGFDTAGGQRKLHKPLAERAHMTLLEVLQAIVLVHFGCTKPLYCGAALRRTYLCIGDTGDIESSAHRRAKLRLWLVATEIL